MSPMSSIAGATVAILGCGAMGCALGLRLLQQGIPVRVYNRTAEKTHVLQSAGASVHPHPADAVNSADWVLSILTDSTALRAVLTGEHGVLSIAPAGRRLIDLGTHLPSELVALANETTARGWPMVEAPMTGSVHDAKHGTLNFLLGGEADDVRWAQPMLKALGRAVFHLGPLGAGNTAKLALNLLVGAMAGGLGEAVALLRAHGLDVASFLSALDGSGLASPLYQRLGQRYLTQDHIPRFSLANLEKDLQWVRDHAQASGLTPQLAPALCGLLARLPPQAKPLDYSVLVGCLASPVS